MSRFLTSAILLLMGCWVGGGKREQPIAPSGPVVRTIAFETDEGTAMNLDVSPDGQEIVFDLLGDIYTLPIQGGEAKLLVEGRAWEVAPRYSPDGTRILFVSDRGGSDALWTVDRSGGNPTQIVGGGGSSLSSPVWSADGSKIVVFWGKPGAGISIVDAAARRISPLEVTSRGTKRNPTLSPNGRYLYFAEQSCGAELAGRIARFDRTAGTQAVVSDTGNRDFKPTVSRTGRWLAFIRYPSTRPYPTGGVAVLRVRDLTNSQERDLVRIPDANDPCGQGTADFLTQYAFTPDDSAIVIHIGGKIHRVPLNGGSPQVIPFRAPVRQQVHPRIPPRRMALDEDSVRIRGIRTPRISPDGRTLVFVALGKLWIQALPGGKPHRLTTSDQLEYAPAISPDGRWLLYLAYTDSVPTLLNEPFNGRQANALASRPMLLSLGTPPAHAPPRALTPEPGAFGTPLWFPDSRRVLVIRQDADPEHSERTRSRFISIDVNSGQSIARGLVPGGLESASGEMAVDERFVKQLSPDGRRVYFIDLGAGLASRGQVLSLASVAIDGGGKQVHLTFPGHNIGFQPDPTQMAAIAPDPRYLLISPGGGVGLHLVPIPPPAHPPAAISFRNGTTRRLRSGPVTGLSWQNARRAIYATGPMITRVDVDSSTPPDTVEVRLYQPPSRARGVVAVRGARIVTMAGSPGRERVIEVGTLVVKDGKIMAVGEADRVSIPREARVIDGRGTTLIPGLADMHQHLGLRTSPRPALDQDDVADLAYGVTLRYDAGTFAANANLEHSERIRTGATIGPRFFYAGEPVSSPWSDLTLEALREVVAWFDAQEVVILKGNPWRRETQQRWAQVARERGIGITAHTESLSQPLTMIADGFTAWEHAKFRTSLYKDVLTLAARSGIHHTPTTGMIIGDAGANQGWRYYYQEMMRHTPGDTVKLARFMGVKALDNLDPGSPLTTSIALPFDSLYLGRMARNLAVMVRAGVNVSIDGHNPPGLLTHWAMWTLKDGGLSAMEALRAATLRGAEKLGIERLAGSLEVGKFADFLILSANPLQDIRNSLKIRCVVVNGFVYDGETLTKLWPTYEPLPRMGWQSAEAYAKLRHAPPWKN